MGARWCCPITAASRAVRSNPLTTFSTNLRNGSRGARGGHTRHPGSGSRTIAKVLGLFFENEFKAIARMMAAFFPQVRTVFEIGGESSKYIRLDENRQSRITIAPANCAAGTGSFLDQQALRMQYSVEEVGGLVCGASSSARIAGRCSGVCQKRHDPRPAEGLSGRPKFCAACATRWRAFQELHRQGRKVEGAGGADSARFRKRRRDQGAGGSV